MRMTTIARIAAVATGIVIVLFMVFGGNDALANGGHVLTVDGVQYAPTKVVGSGPTVHYFTSGGTPSTAFSERHTWTGNGSDNLPCDGQLHWIDNTRLLVISHCEPTETTTTTTPTTTTTTVPETTTTTVPETTTTTVPETTTTTVPETTTTTVPETTTTTDPGDTTTTSIPTRIPSGLDEYVGPSIVEGILDNKFQLLGVALALAVLAGVAIRAHRSGDSL